jgi:hypothetical protein
MTETTPDPQSIEDWVAELSKYEGNSIGHKVAHRAAVIERIQLQSFRRGWDAAKADTN